MSIETPTFETSKTLTKYLQIETEKVIFENEGKEIKANIDYLKEHHLPYPEHYPAPTLSELLRVSPIPVTIDVYNNHCGQIKTYPKGQKQFHHSDNLTEEVAKIIIEYYKKGSS
ncbi:MAG TPA: hypothetical protein DC057_20095 [Spirochaetia bacterium]|nr:hypothetical protein [Spirochaetia bacterium]